MSDYGLSSGYIDFRNGLHAAVISTGFLDDIMHKNAKIIKQNNDESYLCTGTLPMYWGASTVTIRWGDGRKPPSVGKAHSIHLF